MFNLLFGVGRNSGEATEDDQQSLNSSLMDTEVQEEADSDDDLNFESPSQLIQTRSIRTNELLAVRPPSPIMEVSDTEQPIVAASTSSAVVPTTIIISAKPSNDLQRWTLPELILKALPDLKITVPDVLVVGAQSSGKTMLITSLLFFYLIDHPAFTDAMGQCLLSILRTGTSLVTRRPTAIQFLHTEKVNCCEISLRFKDQEANFGEPLFNHLIATLTSNANVPDDAVFAQELEITITCDTVPNIKFTDMPGLTTNDRKFRDEPTKSVESLVREKIMMSSNTVVAVEQAALEDYSTSMVTPLIGTIRKQNRRDVFHHAVLVLSKCDDVSSGAFDRKVMPIITRESQQLRTYPYQFVVGVVNKRHEDPETQDIQNFQHFKEIFHKTRQYEWNTFNNPQLSQHNRERLNRQENCTTTGVFYAMDQIFSRKLKEHFQKGLEDISKLFRDKEEKMKRELAPPPFMYRLASGSALNNPSVDDSGFFTERDLIQEFVDNVSQGLQVCLEAQTLVAASSANNGGSKSDILSRDDDGISEALWLIADWGIEWPTSPAFPFQLGCIETAMKRRQALVTIKKRVTSFIETIPKLLCELVSDLENGPLSAKSSRYHRIDRFPKLVTYFQTCFVSSVSSTVPKVVKSAFDYLEAIWLVEEPQGKLDSIERLFLLIQEVRHVILVTFYAEVTGMLQSISLVGAAAYITPSYATLASSALLLEESMEMQSKRTKISEEYFRLHQQQETLTNCVDLLVKIYSDDAGSSNIATLNTTTDLDTSTLSTGTADVTKSQLREFLVEGAKKMLMMPGSKDQLLSQSQPQIFSGVPLSSSVDNDASQFWKDWQVEFWKNYQKEFKAEVMREKEIQLQRKISLSLSRTQSQQSQSQSSQRHHAKRNEKQSSSQTSMTTSSQQKRSRRDVANEMVLDDSDGDNVMANALKTSAHGQAASSSAAKSISNGAPSSQRSSAPASLEQVHGVIPLTTKTSLHGGVGGQLSYNSDDESFSQLSNSFPPSVAIGGKRQQSSQQILPPQSKVDGTKDEFDDDVTMENSDSDDVSSTETETGNDDDKVKPYSDDESDNDVPMYTCPETRTGIFDEEEEEEDGGRIGGFSSAPIYSARDRNKTAVDALLHTQVDDEDESDSSDDDPSETLVSRSQSQSQTRTNSSQSQFSPQPGTKSDETKNVGFFDTALNIIGAIASPMFKEKKTVIIPSTNVSTLSKTVPTSEISGQPPSEQSNTSDMPNKRRPRDRDDESPQSNHSKAPKLDEQSNVGSHRDLIGENPRPTRILPASIINSRVPMTTPGFRGALPTRAPIVPNPTATVNPSNLQTVIVNNSVQSPHKPPPMTNSNAVLQSPNVTVKPEPGSLLQRLKEKKLQSSQVQSSQV